MSSKGNPRVTVRLTPELLQELENAVVEVNERRKEEPYDLSSLIRKALEDWIAHRERGKAKRPGRARPSPAERTEHVPLVPQKPGGKRT